MRAWRYGFAAASVEILSPLGGSVFAGPGPARLHGRPGRPGVLLRDRPLPRPAVRLQNPVVADQPDLPFPLPAAALEELDRTGDRAAPAAGSAGALRVLVRRGLKQEAAAL